MKQFIINIFGSSGSGSTTLAKAIAKTFNYLHVDVDDALWEPTDPPFTIRRSDDSARAYIIEHLNSGKDTVISGSLVGFGDDIKQMIDLFVFMNLDILVRLSRIQTREEKRFGKRVLLGGDLYDKHLDFLKWVSDYETNPEYIRSRKQHLLWLENVKAPVLRVTEELSIDELMKLVKPFIVKNKR
jgi:adenylate kinase family enzyme